MHDITKMLDFLWAAMQLDGKSPWRKFLGLKPAKGTAPD